MASGFRALINQIAGAVVGSSTPSDNAWGQTGNAGTSADAARADHVHHMPSNPGGGSSPAWQEHVVGVGGEASFDFTGLDLAADGGYEIEIQVPSPALGNSGFIYGFVDDDLTDANYSGDWYGGAALMMLGHAYNGFQHNLNFAKIFPANGMLHIIGQAKGWTFGNTVATPYGGCHMTSANMSKLTLKLWDNFNSTYVEFPEGTTARLRVG